MINYNELRKLVRRNKAEYGVVVFSVALLALRFNLIVNSLAVNSKLCPESSAIWINEFLLRPPLYCVDLMIRIMSSILIRDE